MFSCKRWVILAELLMIASLILVACGPTGN